MSDYKVTDSELTGIANAIRTKGGTSSQLVFPDGFTSAIGAIPTGGGSTLVTKNIIANGTYDAEDDEADGYSSVVVNVPSSGVQLISRSDWDAMSIAQKNQYGIVGVQDDPNAYEVGVLYNGVLAGLPLIPKMTSANEPSGVASASSTFVAYTSAYMAFNQIHTNGDMSNGWLPSSGYVPTWLMYEFPSTYKVKLKTIDIWTANNGVTAQKNVYIEGRVNSEWVNLLFTEKEILTFTGGTSGGDAQKFNFRLNDSLAIDAVRLRFDQILYGSGEACTIDEMQVYGDTVPVS